MQVITLVGRDSTIEEFIPKIFRLLYGGYKIIGFHSLGEPGIDHKERFLCLITASEDHEFDFETQESRLKNSGEYGVKLHDSLEEALEYSQTEYDLSEDKARNYTEYQELVEEFPLPTAAEREQWSVMDAFIKLGRVEVVPAQLYDERAIAIVSVTHGPDESRITPLAILATEEIVENLKLPGED
jgi:hypothetical protein